MQLAGTTELPATHFFHPGMKRVYKASLKLHLEKAIRDFTNARFRA